METQALLNTLTTQVQTCKANIEGQQMPTETFTDCLLRLGREHPLVLRYRMAVMRYSDLSDRIKRNCV